VNENARKILDCAARAALAAGEILGPRLGKAGRTREKSSGGPVTDCDLRAEEATLDVIQRAFPSHAILSEERGVVRSGFPRWVVDPLDGTSNFIRGVPWYAISVAFETGAGTEVGVVYAPALGLLFSAIKGRGAHLNGRAVHASNKRTLRGSLMDVGLPREGWANSTVLGGFSRLSAAGADLRSLNACALDLAFVACGRLEAYWDEFVSPWDMAAGGLLVREAEGLITTESARTKYEGQRLLASNAPLHKPLRRLLRIS
jgi:myo-inositol-1(or 4)-monophosphatase